MNHTGIVFQKLTAKESSVVSGGTSTPMFVLNPTNRNQGGQILNADGNGNSINVSGSNNGNTTNTNIIDPLQLALPAIQVAV